MKELEMILAAITQLGAAGKEAFIWWLVFDKGLLFLGWMLALYALIVIVRGIVHAATIGARLRDAMGVGSPGPLSYEEEREMFRWIAQRRDRPVEK